MRVVIESFEFSYRIDINCVSWSFEVFDFLSFYIIDVILLDFFIIINDFCFYIYNLIVVRCRDRKFTVDEFQIYKIYSDYDCRIINDFDDDFFNSSTSLLPSFSIRIRGALVTL